MALSNFTFIYPPELIAQEAMEPRDASRMMVLDRVRQQIDHSLFKKLPDYFLEGDVLVLNNTKVLPARLWAKKKTGGKVEVLMVGARHASPLQWNCLIFPAKGLELASSLFFSYRGEEVEAKLVQDFGKMKVLEFPSGFSVKDLMLQEGAAPLPPYIHREFPRADDLHRYQSIFAEKDGAIAAPTASLHFTEKVFQELKNKGVEIHFITLHVGLGTFEPIRSEKIEDHEMQTEYYEISLKVLEAIQKAKQKGRSVIAVGTTVVRALESYFENSVGAPLGAPKFWVQQAAPLQTNLFITPGYKFKIIDRFLTNFHQPCSTPLLLTSAFAGKDFLFRAYQEAIEKNYRLFSYGDCMLVL